MNDKRAWVMERCESIALWDGFDDSLIGIASRCGQDTIAIYDRDRMIAKLEKEMPSEDAEEYLSFNVENAHIGPLTPMIMERIPPRSQLRGIIRLVEVHATDAHRYRAALERIAEMKDEPYCAEFAKDTLSRGEQK